MRTLLPVLFLSLFTCTGCATLMTGGGHSQTVRLNSEPRGADVYVDNNLIGKTPTVASLSRKDDHIVRMEMPGYSPQTATIKHGPNVWTFGNLLIGGLIGFGVDAFSGSWEGLLNPNDINCKFNAHMAQQSPQSPLGPEPLARKD